ncbi:MAG: copper amine oxidase N-terminal domain-containing protein [Clostridia bacterium]|nr:copper amine oxidase N-terminal domain-containing protein [Clostridia bacterium]
MKKLVSIILVCVLTLSAMVIPASADEIYYPCYVGTWTNTDSGNPIKLEIYSVTGNSMDFDFQYGQFAVNVYNATISGTKVNGSYYEVWDGGDFVVNGTITLDLGDSCIWLYWHPYENGRDGGVRSYQMTNGGFQYKTVAEDPIKVLVNGAQLSFEQEPVIVNDRVLVPMRAIFEALGATVTWVPANRHHGDGATADKGNKSIVLEIDSTYMSISENGKATEITLDTPSILYNGYTLVPVRAVSEAFDANVTWDGETRTVSISE